MKRFAKQYILAHPSDCVPPHRLDLTPGGRDDTKVRWLEGMFREAGFSRRHSALVGYPLDGKIQLLSGTHRHEAATRTDTMLPIRMVLRSDVEAAWGTERWADLIRDVPVEDLEMAEVIEGREAPGLDERVDLSRDYNRPA
jgi:hypothetical protein